MRLTASQLGLQYEDVVVATSPWKDADALI